MSDTRFTILGIGFIFAGFLILGIFGSDYQISNVEMTEFGDCYEYSENNEPIPIDCSYKVFDQTIFFGVVIGLIAAGAISLIKGARGNWDSKVRPEDMVGPGGEKNKDNED